MNIALLGFGTVGRAVYNIIGNKKELLGKDICVKYILVRSKENKNVDESLLTTCYEDILNDKSIDTVIEMMGASVSYQYIKKALIKGKNVITANKEVIALYIDELIEIAHKHKCEILFEASVGGGIPIINAIMNSAGFNNITKISGILNGTTNFILSNMQIQKMSFNEALALAQEKGFAEADPTADLLGLDVVRKIAILTDLAFNTKVDIKKIHNYGIKNINRNIVGICDALGYKIKFMAISEKIDNNISITVEPVLIKKSEMIANVDYEFNVVEYYGDASDTQIMYGKGAGFATANSIVNDLVLLINNYKVKYKNEFEYNVCGNLLTKGQYLLKLNDEIDQSLVYKSSDEFIITVPITGEKLNGLLDKIDFYARIL